MMNREEMSSGEGMMSQAVTGIDHEMDCSGVIGSMKVGTIMVPFIIVVHEEWKWRCGAEVTKSPTERKNFSSVDGTSQCVLIRFRHA